MGLTTKAIISPANIVSVLVWNTGPLAGVGVSRVDPPLASVTIDADAAILPS
jgi:hypothetical protein